MSQYVQQHRERIREACTLLRQAERPVRLLATLAWPPEVKLRFFSQGASELPRPLYAVFDARPTFDAVSHARRLIGAGHPVEDWLARLAEVIEGGARMLAGIGTAAFFEQSRLLYGAPTDPLRDESSNSLELARSFHLVLDDLAHVDLGAPPDACVLAETVAADMTAVVRRHFGDQAPIVEIVDQLSANALAGARRIRIRRGACFTDRDLSQLVQHEAFVHVGTSLNGLAQVDLPILAAGHAGTTRTQEGLAVFAEFISGSIDLDRLRRLADRVVAIQMAIDGADFLDVYRFFLEQCGSESQSFENARRIFRGGVLEGGAPFTKDCVYLDGLLRVHSFLRSIVTSGRADCLRLLFCGKLDIEDMPALVALAEAGMCRPPRYLPPWASDLRFLIAYLAYSRFLNTIDAKRIAAHYEQMLGTMPPSSAIAV
jgi:uncharacterized protein (TIGR02421 family)